MKVKDPHLLHTPSGHSKSVYSLAWYGSRIARYKHILQPDVSTGFLARASCKTHSVEDNSSSSHANSSTSYLSSSCNKYHRIHVKNINSRGKRSTREGMLGPATFREHAVALSVKKHIEPRTLHLQLETLTSTP